jgi:phospholipase C
MLRHVSMSPRVSVVALAITVLLTACAAPSDEDAEPADAPTTQESAWDTESADHEGESTHLWIVDRAIDILAKHGGDATAARAVALLNKPGCRTNWQQGLVDADFKAQYNGGRTNLPLHPSDTAVALSGATWESHFFDPDTGKNYKGTPATAFSETNSHVGRALENHLGAGGATACYELGLSLHFFTDLTQPMHATNFTALDRPAKLHSNLEGYSLELQDRFPLADWSGAPRGTIKDFVMQTAKDSKPLFQAGVVAIVNAYKAYTGWHILTCRNIDAEAWRFVERQHIDYKFCWAGNPGVDAMIGKTLESAQDHTAKYLYLVAQQIAASEVAQ